MILTSVANKKVFQLVADAMTTQYPRLHEHERQPGQPCVPGGRRAWHNSPKKTFERKTTKFLTKAFAAQANCSDESCCEQSEDESDDDDENLTGY